MSDNAAATTKGKPVWHLLSEFSVAKLPGDIRQQLDPVTEAVQGLDLQPVQLERIRRVLAQAFSRPIRSGEVAATGRLYIRIWVLHGCSCGRGWGLFLVEKQADHQHIHKDTDLLVELFLYQENDG